MEQHSGVRRSKTLKQRQKWAPLLGALKMKVITLPPMLHQIVIHPSLIFRASSSIRILYPRQANDRKINRERRPLVAISGSTRSPGSMIGCGERAALAGIITVQRAATDRRAGGACLQFD